MKVKAISVLMLALALMMSACGKSDADLKKAVEDKLTADKVTGVTVAVASGVATLTGEVADAAVKSKAEASAKAVEGIKSVINNCGIKPAPTPPPASPDQMIEGTVNQAIKKLALAGSTVTATVANGEINLAGEVASKEDLAKVMQAASEAKGNAKKINNNVTVKK